MITPGLELAVTAPVLESALDAPLDIVAAPLDPLLGMPRDGLGPMQLRGRSRVRSASPRSSRLRSQAARTPPSTPDPSASPTSVLPSSPSAKGSDQHSLLLPLASGGFSELVLSSGPASSSRAWRALELLSSGHLVRPRRARSCSPVRPPGFEFSSDPRTPPFVSAFTPDCTPSPRTVITKSPLPATHMEPLFSRPQEPLLSPPMSSPPLRPVARRKTLAGQDIIRSEGFSLRRAGNRLRAKRQAETFVCRGLGIIKDGEVVTEAALQEFAHRFEGQVSADVLLAMRALFRLGVPEDEDDDEAILSLGGAAALDLDGITEDAAAVDA